MAEETEHGAAGAGGVNQPAIAPPVVSPPIAPSIPVAPPRLSPPTAPPTVPGALMTASTRRVWPTTIGIIGIVISGLGMIRGMWTLATPMVTNFTRAGIPGANAGPDAFAFEPSLWKWYIATGSIGIVRNVWLLVVAIGLLRRKFKGTERMTLWACAAVLLVILGAAMAGYAQYMVLRSTFNALPTPATQGLPRQYAQTMSIGRAAFAGLWAAIVGLAYPVFILIWMRRASVREHAATWGTSKT